MGSAADDTSPDLHSARETAPRDNLVVFASLNTGVQGVHARDLETSSVRKGDRKYEYRLSFQHQAPF